VDEPLATIAQWVEDAAAAGLAEPNTMVLSTVGSGEGTGGRPSARAVLLKDVSGGGLVFFTNYQSRKGRELAVNPWCAATLVWPSLGRQARVVGRAGVVDPAESDAYWATRPRESQLAAWASPQSEVLADRAALDALVADVAARFEGVEAVPRPPHWGGLRIVPDEVELWTRGEHRLHDRLRWTRQGDGWAIDRLAP
jgi:pyridoxamine 5'-phosphate oxidase